MKRAAIILISCLAALTSARAQESYVQARYEKSVDRTIVHSDVLYVINTPSQLMQIQLVGRYSGNGKPQQMPDRIYAEFYSFAPEPLYQLDLKHRLLVKADAKVIDFGLLSYSKVEGKGRAAKEKSNTSAPKTNLEFSVSVPPTAVITTMHEKDDLTVEFLSIAEFSLADLKLLADADDLVMKLGDTVFRFRPIHMTILHQFTQAVSPENIKPSVRESVGETMPADVPSDVKQTPLAETLRWLKTHIERNGATNDILTPKRFEPLKFDSCRISYRAVPLIRTSQVSSTIVHAIMAYQFDLADLNPEAVRVADLADYAAVSMVTRDYQPKIRMFKHANDGGPMGRTLDEALTESASINFKNKAMASQFKTALSHAINLCHAQR